MIIDLIRNNSDLCGLSREGCSEHAVSVQIDDKLLIDGFVNHEKIIILKMDAYYHSDHMHNPPPSIDCLVIVRCDDGKYNFYLIELRDCKRTKRIRPREIKGKFVTIIDDFIGKRYEDIFVNCFKDVAVVNLWVVTDPLKTCGLSDEEYEKKVKGTVIDAYSSMKPMKVFGKYCLITPILPRQSYPCPVITSC